MHYTNSLIIHTPGLRPHLVGGRAGSRGPRSAGPPTCELHAWISRRIRSEEARERERERYRQDDK